MQFPVTWERLQSFVEAVLYSVWERAAWFRTPHLLWPWVSWGPNQALVPRFCPGSAAMGRTSAPGPTRDWCSALARPVPIQAVGHPSPGSVLLLCTPSPHPVYQLRPPPWITPTTSPLMHPLPDAGSSLSPALPSFPLLNDGSRGLGLNPDSRVRGCETRDPLGLTFLICEMGMMTGPALLAGFEVKWE